ncbi:thiamine-phosphate kinase [Geomesophilobacter sediminis]|uniref:Thiamine-monophosphate kinase n=1 Tax=Geomesophilobacter sediminis TaxID=2798584 RepID=A0A8J7M3B6_9BACT|nr:thiamine-phosphate kinase [Geomesophilobacter sediminis]MBJ6727883.1 thiamine-phosphate kinase [Geomesophilobacter sediminis]
MKLAEVGEFGLIRRIAEKIPAHRSVVLGIGDDAAGILPSAGCITLITSDMLLEGVHFDLSFSDPISLGRKSLAVNLSDLAAMGALPRQFLLSLGLPRSIEVEFIDRFMEGVLATARSYGAILVGGDTCASKSGLVISITALGEQRPERVLKRSAARVGDLVFVTGTLGDAAAGLELLQRGVREGRLVDRQLAPEPRVAAGAALADAGFVHAMIDVSDGLVSDLGHICELSGVGAKVEVELLPLSEEYRRVCGADPYPLALSGGEDYELLFTAAPGQEKNVLALMQRLGLQTSIIGEITDGKGVELFRPDGSPYSPAKSGFDHFG